MVVTGSDGSSGRGSVVGDVSGSDGKVHSVSLLSGLKIWSDEFSSGSF